MGVAGERTLFSIKTKSGALRDDSTAHTEWCSFAATLMSVDKDPEPIGSRRAGRKRPIYRGIIQIFTRIRAVFNCLCNSGVQIPHLSAFKSEKEVLLRPGMSAVSY